MRGSAEGAVASAKGGKKGKKECSDDSQCPRGFECVIRRCPGCSTCEPVGGSDEKIEEGGFCSESSDCVGGLICADGGDGGDRCIRRDGSTVVNSGDEEEIDDEEGNGEPPGITDEEVNANIDAAKEFERQQEEQDEMERIVEEKGGANEDYEE